MSARGYPQLDIGDLLGVYRDDSLPWVDTHVAWEDMELPWNGMVLYKTVALKIKYKFKGGLSMSIDSNAHSEQQSEFKVDGSLTGQIKELNRSAAKLDRNYYGVTLSREFGLKVDRSDNLASATWNADELRFVADGEDALWFDVPSRKFHFSGTLVGVDGEFSGTVWAATIIASQMQGGTIEGTTIRASEFYGGTFSTRETGYPRIVMSETSNLLSAEYSANRGIYIDPNNYLTNQFPHLRWISDGYEAHIHHAGSAGLYIESDDISFLGDVSMEGGSTFWVPNASSIEIGMVTLQELLDDKVSYSEYTPMITYILSEIESLKNA